MRSKREAEPVAMSGHLAPSLRQHVWIVKRWSLRKWLLGPCLTVIVACIMAPTYFAALKPPSDVVVDFFQEWASARNYRNGLPLYTNHRITIPLYLSTGAKAIAPQGMAVDVNAHPPTSVLLVLPFAFLRYQDAVLVWNLLSLAMLGVSLALIWHGLRIPLSYWSVFPLVTSLLVCAPLVLQVTLAQLDLVILLMLTGVWTSDRSARPVLAGILTGAAAAIKVFPAFVFLYFIMKRKWKVLIAGAVTVALLTALTAALFGIDAYRAYFTDVLPQLAKFRALWPNASLVGFWTKLFDPPLDYPRVEPLWRSPMVARAGIAASLTLVVISLALVVRRATSRATEDVAYGISLSAMLLACPITWEHYLLLMLFPLAATWVYLSKSREARLVLVIILVAFWSWPAVIQHLVIPGGISTGVAKPIHTLTVLSYQFYALIALFCLGTRQVLAMQPPVHDVTQRNPIAVSVARGADLIAREERPG
jgi:hypothetical protein